jgi:16S rRNA processing protein RimM
MVMQADKVEAPDSRVTVGRITGVYGVKGWLRIYSYTEPRGNILEYNPWLLRLADGWRSVELLDGRVQGKGVIAHLAGCEDRDQAARWMDAEIAVRREQLPAAGAGEYYWRDLIGLRVITTAGEELGIVDHLLETGANDVLVVQGKREVLIPYALGEVVTAVDLEAGELHVDWDPEY